MSNEVVWEIFCKVFKRSCGPPTRLVGPTDRSAGLLLGRTHLSGMAASLVGGDPGVPMSHRYEYKGSPRPPYIGQRARSVPRLLVGYDQET
jgi:hypothetical protein